MTAKKPALPSTSAFPSDTFKERSHSIPDFPFRVCQDFWFSDGNVILSAGPFAFKVHRGQLERHADIFHTMLSIPQPDNADSIINLCDSPTDVYHLLRALYDGLYEKLFGLILTIFLADSPTGLTVAPSTGARMHRYFRQPFVQDFSFLASVLRLSCKYFISIPRRRCLERLQTYFPATLAEWDRRERMSLTPDGSYEPRHEIPSPIHVINLARELNVGSVLPAAFYDLARYATSKTASGAEPLAHYVLDMPSTSTCTNTPSDSTTNTPSTFPFPHSHPRHPSSSTSSAPSFSSSSRAMVNTHYYGPSRLTSLTLIQDTTPVQLSHDDLVLTFRGREAMQRSVSTFLDAQVKSRAPARGCTGGGGPEPGQACRGTFHFMVLNTLRMVMGVAPGRDGDPLFTLSRMIDMLHHAEWVDGRHSRGFPMCDKCREEFIPVVHAGRQAIWDQIPGWFELEPYDILRARDEELNER